MNEEDVFKNIQKLKEKRKLMIEKFVEKFEANKNWVSAKEAIYFRRREKEIRLELFKLRNGLDNELLKEFIETEKGHHEYYTCIRKMGYATAIDLNNNCIKNSFSSGVKMVGYYCNYCDLFHLSSHPVKRDDLNIKPILTIRGKTTV